MTQPTPPGHQRIIEAALDDWWITTDPIEPFHSPAVAEQVEMYLLNSGYTIAPDTRTSPMKTPTARTTCDASHATDTTTFGPCVLRHRHDGPIHQDANGATWWLRPTPTRPSRADIAFLAFLVVACLTGTILALVRGDWGWAFVGGVAACALGRELAEDLTDRRKANR